ncbi:MAG: hypothetical protein ACOC3V_02910 [bacterium]
METIEVLKLELKPYKDTLVIDPLNRVIKLHDVIFDEDDYYWVFECKGELYYISCTLEWIPLKGHIPNEKYERLVNVWNLNNKVKAI